MSTYKELIEKFAEDKEQFGAIYKKINPSLRHFVYSYVHDSAMTDDIVSTTMFNAYTHFDRYDKNLSEFNTWCFAIARNECLTTVNKNKRTRILSIDQSVSGDSDDGDSFIEFLKDDSTSLNENELTSLFDTVFEILTDKPLWKDIIYMKYVNGFSNSQIAETLNKKFISDYELLLDEFTKAETQLEKTKISAKMKKFKKDSFISESTIKNNSFKCEKFLQEHFKDKDITDFYN